MVSPLYFASRLGFAPRKGSTPRTAFTLVELMVVVAIIALLISILLPSLAKAREQAYQVKCASHLKTIWQGIFYYAEDKSNGDGYLVQLSNQWAARNASQLYPGSYWAYQILPYVDIGRSKAGTRGGLLRCPADENPRFRIINAPAGQEALIGDLPAPGRNPLLMKMQNDALAARGAPAMHLEPISYTGSCDARTRNIWHRSINGMLWPIQNVPPKLANVDKPYCYPILAEAFASSKHKNQGCFRWVDMLDYEASDKSYRLHYGGESRVTNGTNWCFADGHVQWHPVSYVRNQLICCIQYNPNIMRSSFAKRIDQNCNRN